MGGNAADMGGRQRITIVTKIFYNRPRACLKVIWGILACKQKEDGKRYDDGKRNAL